MSDMTIAIVLGAAAIIAALDQLFKLLVLQYVVPVKSIEVIKGLFSLTYVENRGVAFGMLQNHVWVFAVITLLLISIMIYLLASKRLTGKLFLVSAMLLIGGGIGNLIDRLFRGFVVDYLSLSFFPPVCNFADYCITVGAVLFVIAILLAGKKAEKNQKPQPEESSEADVPEESKPDASDADEEASKDELPDDKTEKE